MVVVAPRLRGLSRCSPRPVLLPGGPVHRPAFDTCARSPAAGRGAGCAVSGRRCAPDQLMQRPVLRALLLPYGKRLRSDGAKQRAPLGVDHGHHDLRAAGRVEHDPIQDGADTGHRHELAYCDRVHTTSLPGRDPRQVIAAQLQTGTNLPTAGLTPGSRRSRSLATTARVGSEAAVVSAPLPG